MNSKKIRKKVERGSETDKWYKCRNEQEEMVKDMHLSIWGTEKHLIKYCKAIKKDTEENGIERKRG